MAVPVKSKVAGQGGFVTEPQCRLGDQASSMPRVCQKIWPVFRKGSRRWGVRERFLSCKRLGRPGQGLLAGMLKLRQACQNMLLYAIESFGRISRYSFVSEGRSVLFMFAPCSKIPPERSAAEGFHLDRRRLFVKRGLVF